jgi:hypothetical protein
MTGPQKRGHCYNVRIFRRRPKLKRKAKPDVGKLYRWFGILGWLLTVGFIPLVVYYRSVLTMTAITLTEQYILALSLGIYLAILIIPGRGQMKPGDARFLAIFLLAIAALMMLWGFVLVPFFKDYLLRWEVFDRTSMSTISRIAFLQAIVGALALAAKGVALAIPYVKKYTAKLTELSGFK